MEAKCLLNNSTIDWGFEPTTLGAPICNALTMVKDPCIVAFRLEPRLVIDNTKKICLIPWPARVCRNCRATLARIPHKSLACLYHMYNPDIQTTLFYSLPTIETYLRSKRCEQFSPDAKSPANDTTNLPFQRNCVRNLLI